MTEQLEDGTKGRGKGGGTGFIVGLLVATLLAAGAGGGLGFVLGPDMATSEERKKAEEERGKQAKEETRFKPQYAAPGAVVRLKPVIANLRAPFRSWVRLEAAMLVSGDVEKDKEKARAVEMLKAVVEQDITAWLRTLALKDLEGPSSLTFLHDDLTERARIRSKGLVREIIVLTLVVE